MLPYEFDWDSANSRLAYHTHDVSILFAVRRKQRTNKKLSGPNGFLVLYGTGGAKLSFHMVANFAFHNRTRFIEIASGYDVIRRLERTLFEEDV
jgi:hypothetical protein